MADTIDSLQLEINAKATKANDAIDRLVGKLDRLTTSLSRVNGTNLNGLANGVQRLGNAMQVMNTIKTADFTRLATNLTKLGSVNVSALNSAASSMSHLTRAFNSLGTVSANAQAVGEMAKNIAKLGNKSVQTAITNIPQLAIAMNNLMATLSRAPRVSQNVIQMTNALANLASQGSRVGTASNSIVRGFNRTSASANTAKKSFGGLASVIGKFYAKYFMVIRGIKGLWNSIESSMNYVETLNYFGAAFEQVAENADLRSWKEYGYKSAEEYEKSFSKRAEELTQKMTGFKVSETGVLENTRIKNLGIDPNTLMNYQATFAQMASSIGIASETSLKLSNALTMIGADLASVKNMDFNKVWNDMASGLAGMSRTLDKYGVNIRNVNLQQKLNEIGIKANISELNQNDKALLRTIILLKSTKYAWGDMADTIEQPANQLRLLKSNISNLGRTIGNLFLPTLSAALPYINGFVIALQRLAENLLKILGFEDFEWGAIGSSDADLSSLYDESDALDDIAESSKKASDNLQGFDKINKLSDDESSSNAQSSKISGLLDTLLTDALSEYQKKWNEAFDNMENKATKIADKIEKAFKKLFKRIQIGDFEGIGADISYAISKQLEKINWKKVYNGAKNFGSGLAKFLNGLIKPRLFKEVGKTIAGSLNTSLHFLNSFGTTFNWKNFGYSIAQGINKFFKTFDFGLLADTFDAFVQGLADAIIHFVSSIDFIDMIKGALNFLKNIDIETVGIIISAITFKVAAGVIKKAALTQLVPTIQQWFNKNSSKFFKIGISITIATISIKIAEDKLKPIFNEYDLEEIKNASDEMFNDWFGKNPISLTLSEMFVFTSTLIVEPSVIINGLKSLWDDVCSGDFKFNLFNLVEFPSYNEISDALQLMFKDIKHGDFKLSVFKPEWELPSINDFKKSWNLFKKDIKHGDFKLSVFKPEWELPSWNSISSKINSIGLGIKHWWENDIVPWFTITKWKQLFVDVKKGFVEGWNGVKNWWNNTAIVNWWSNNVSPWFSKEKWNFRGIKNGLESAFNSAIEGVKGIWNAFANWINDALTFEFKGFSKEFDVMGKNIEIGIPSFSVDLGMLPTFATGGFPNLSSPFVVGENGPEIMGGMYGRPAVANNHSITEGIEEAAYRGMMRALSENRNASNTNVTVTLEGDSKKIFNVVQKESRKYKMQTGFGAFPV